MDSHGNTKTNTKNINKMQIQIQKIDKHANTNQMNKYANTNIHILLQRQLITSA